MSDQLPGRLNVDTPASTRDALVERFARWLDAILAREEPPGGIDAEIMAAVSAAPIDSMDATDDGLDSAGAADARTDAYALWSALTVLAHEVKLQGRAFKDLSVTLDSQAARSADELRTLYQERERQLQREVERRCQRQMLEPLLDLRDRLGRGVESARAAVAAASDPASRSWLSRVMPASAGEPRAAAALAAVVRGYELGVEHLDRMLADLDVRPIRCQDQPFDPHRMNAIDTEPSSTVPAGTVLEVYRSGWEWHGEVFRPAQVKVSVSPAPDARGEGHARAGRPS